MERAQLAKHSEEFLAAWNAQDVERLLKFYTEDCHYQDPNTRGPIVGHEKFRRYLTKLFQGWKMHWSLKEAHPFGDGSGGAFLWHAEIQSAKGGKVLKFDGMDLVLFRGEKVSRNEVYFDRMAVFGGK
jgi:ketosteroid isomerase-like protein